MCTLIYVHKTISFTRRLHCSLGEGGWGEYVLYFISVLHNIIEPHHLNI